MALKKCERLGLVAEKSRYVVFVVEFTRIELVNDSFSLVYGKAVKVDLKDVLDCLLVIRHVNLLEGRDEDEFVSGPELSQGGWRGALYPLFHPIVIAVLNVKLDGRLVIRVWF